MAGIIAVTSSVSSFALKPIRKDDEIISNIDYRKTGFYFLSDIVPLDVTEYAHEYFLSFSYEELEYLGFTDNEIANLGIGPAITSCGCEQLDDNIYYFPVMCKDSILAMLTAYKDETGEISIQFGKSQLSDSLNKLKTTGQKPYILVSTEQGMYAVNKNNILTELEPSLYSASDSDDDIPDTVDSPQDDFKENSNQSNGFKLSVEHDLLADINAFYAQSPKDRKMIKGRNIAPVNKIQPDIDYRQIKKENKNIVNVKPLVIYNTTTGSKANGNVVLSVPYVPNSNNFSGHKQGICWASSMASILIWWYKEMENQDLGSEIYVRDFIFANASSFSENTAGSPAWAEDVLDYYIPNAYYQREIYKTNPKWIQEGSVIVDINANMPIYVYWDNRFSAKDSDDHIAVINGYSLLKDSSSKIRGVYMMSPERDIPSYYTYLSYGSAFKRNGNTFDMWATVR